MAASPYLVLLLICTAIFCTGCLQNADAVQGESSIDETQAMGNPAKESSDYSPADQQQPRDACPPSTAGCEITRGPADALSIVCPDGRQYTRGAMGEMAIQYAEKQITIDAAGEEFVQGFDYEDAQCLIDWLYDL